MVWVHMQQSSMFVVHQDNQMRLLFGRILASRCWFWFTSLLLVINFILLSLNHPFHDKTTSFRKLMKHIGNSITIIFLIEMVAKIIFLGFIYNFRSKGGAYILSYWNIIDFIVVVSSSIDLFSGGAIDWLKSMIVFRSLRPLKVVNKSKKMKIIIQSLYSMIGELWKVVSLIGALIFMVACMMMQLFKGKFYRCYKDHASDTPLPSSSNLITKEDCLRMNYSWIDPYYNYDNILKATLNVFQIMTDSNWVTLLENSVDVTEIDKLPIEYASYYYFLVYFILIIFGHVLFMNLLLGIVLDSFNETKDRIEGYTGLSPEQKEWAELQKFIYTRRLSKAPSSRNNAPFEIFMAYCSLFNLLIMAITHEGESITFLRLHEIINFIFILLFHVECLISGLAEGLHYLGNRQNQIDMVLLLMTDVLLLIVQLDMIHIHLHIYKVPFILRCIRLNHLLKHLNKSKRISVILNTYNIILGQIANIGFLFSLFVYIFAILGMQFFATIPIAPYKDSTHPDTISNFSSFQGSVLVIIKCATMQRWEYYLEELVKVKTNCEPNHSLVTSSNINGCGSLLAYPFFFSFIFIVPLIILNLFVAVVVQGFNRSLREYSSQLLPSHHDQLLLNWKQYDPHALGYISVNHFACLLHEFPPPLGFYQDSFLLNNSYTQTKQFYFYSPNKKVSLSKKAIFKVIQKYNLRLYANNMIHFKDVYLCISHNAICKKYKLQKLQISTEKYVISCLKEGWYDMFPDLKKAEIENKNRLNMNALEYLALNIIKSFINRWKEKNNYKKMNTRIKMNKVQDQMNQYLASQKIQVRKKAIFQLQKNISIKHENENQKQEQDIKIRKQKISKQSEFSQDLDSKIQIQTQAQKQKSNENILNQFFENDNIKYEESRQEKNNEFESDHFKINQTNNELYSQNFPSEIQINNYDLDNSKEEQQDQIKNDQLDEQSDKILSEIIIK